MPATVSAVSSAIMVQSAATALDSVSAVRSFAASALSFAFTAANLDVGSAFNVGNDYYVYICDSRIDSENERYVIDFKPFAPSSLLR